MKIENVRWLTRTEFYGAFTVWLSNPRLDKVLLNCTEDEYRNMVLSGFDELTSELVRVLVSMTDEEINQFCKENGIDVRVEKSKDC